MSRKSTILVVDDENIIRNIMVKLIYDMGYPVLEASNGTQAVTMIRRHKPDLVLLDMLMPSVDSMDVLKTVRGDDSLKDITIILIAAIDDLDIIASYIETGADDFLPKPFNKALLRMKIRNALAYRDSQMELQSTRLSSQNFCQQLAHDLNNALTAIMMTTELLLMDQDSSLSKQHLEDIIESTEQISALIKQRKHASSGKPDKETEAS